MASDHPDMLSDRNMGSSSAQPYPAPIAPEQALPFAVRASRAQFLLLSFGVFFGVLFGVFVLASVGQIANFAVGIFYTEVVVLLAPALILAAALRQPAARFLRLRRASLGVIATTLVLAVVNCALMIHLHFWILPIFPDWMQYMLDPSGMMATSVYPWE